MGGIVKAEEFDYFHEVKENIYCKLTTILIYFQAIIHAELGRASSRAVVDGLLAGLVIGLPPILNYGSPELYKKIVPDVCIFNSIFWDNLNACLVSFWEEVPGFGHQ